MNIMRAYLPMGTDPQAIVHLMLAHGGYTITEGYGYWNNQNGGVDAERVAVYECVSDSAAPLAQLSQCGKRFLKDNPMEQEFLGVIIADYGVSKIQIQQEKATV